MTPNCLDCGTPPIHGMIADRMSRSDGEVTAWRSTTPATASTISATRLGIDCHRKSVVATGPNSVDLNEIIGITALSSVSRYRV